MEQSLAIPRVIPDDWKRLDLIINKIKLNLGRDSSPVFTGLTLDTLTVDDIDVDDIDTDTITIKDSDGDIVFFVDENELYFVAEITIPIEAGMPMGLLLALTYAGP